jgi:hypothetical protein
MPGRRRGVDAKPRGLSPGQRPRTTRAREAYRRRQRPTLALKHQRQLEHLQQDGSAFFSDYDRSGRRGALVIATTGVKGGTFANPATSFAWRFRSRLKPIDIKPTTITDAAGVVIATITVDPVTGKRTRTDVARRTETG